MSVARQRAHLRRAARAGLVGHEAVAALKAMIFADLAFLRDGKRFEKSLEHNLGRLAKFVKRYIGHDGVVAERAPHLQVAVLRHLLDVRAALASAERRAPAELIAAVDAILSAAMTTACRLPAPPVTGYHFPRPGRLDSPAARRSAPRRAPVRPVQAMQRSPPVPDRLATKVPIRLKGR